MRWHLLDESERQTMGEFVAVAVAYDLLTAVLVRDYLREAKIPAYTPTSSGPIPSITYHLIWVPKRDLEESLTVLKELSATWQGGY